LKVRIVIGAKTYEVEYDSADSSPSPLPDAIPDRAQSIVLPTIQSADRGTDVDESKVIVSPVAGIVTRINVEPGQSVKIGDVVLVVEAMKMENNLEARSEARVKTIGVTVGDTVKAGQIVATFE